MTFSTRAILSLVAAVSLSACAEGMVSPVDAARADSAALYFYNDAVETGPVIDQVAALNQSAEDLLRRSTVDGAIIGAVLGCNVTALTGGNARKCATGAAVADVGGAIVGNMRGEREVAARVELVSANDLARDINTATSQFQSIKAALPTFLAEQEAELNRLTMQLITGEIDQAQHDRDVAVIVAQRAELANALTMAARDTQPASDNLQTATRRGQDGPDWHIEAIGQLADDVQSARSSFSML